MRYRALLVAAATTMGVVGSGTPVGAATPEVVVSPGSVQPGQSVLVHGYGFPPTIDLGAQVCGNDALDGSADCALSSSQEIATTSFGQFELSMVVALPPVPCPCVVYITSGSLDITPTGPITIVGAPTAPLRKGETAAVTRPLEVRGVGLSGWGPWTAWFGASPERTMTLRVHNPNTAPYEQPPLVLRVGRPGSQGSVVSTRDVGTLAAGETKTITVPVTLSPLSFGTEQVHGTVGFTGYTGTFSDDTVVVPWGLIAVALVLIQVILLAIRNRVRRRVAGSQVPVGAKGVPVVLYPPSAGQGEGGEPPMPVLAMAVPISSDRPMPGVVVSPPPPATSGPAADENLPTADRSGPQTLLVRQLPVTGTVVATGEVGAASAVLVGPLGSRLSGHGQGDATQVVALVDIRGDGEPSADAMDTIIGSLQAQMRIDDVIVQVGPRTIGAVCSARPRSGTVAGATADPAARLAARLAGLADEAMAAGSVTGRSRAVAVSAESGAGVEPGEMVRQALAGLAG
jgi:hypothetical protein